MGIMSLSVNNSENKMSNERIWCTVSSQGIEQDTLTRDEAKAIERESEAYRAMLTVDAEEMFEEDED